MVVKPAETQTDAVGNLWTYQYDEASRLVSRIDPKDQETEYDYNLRKVAECGSKRPPGRGVVALAIESGESPGHAI